MEIIVSKVFSFYSKDRCKSLFTGKQRNTNMAFRQKEKKKEKYFFDMLLSPRGRDLIIWKFYISKIVTIVMPISSFCLVSWFHELHLLVSSLVIWDCFSCNFHIDFHYLSKMIFFYGCLFSFHWLVKIMTH